jgi:hypothetical protein
MAAWVARELLKGAQGRVWNKLFRACSLNYQVLPFWETFKGTVIQNWGHSANSDAFFASPMYVESFLGEAVLACRSATHQNQYPCQHNPVESL